jgi:hypothetical protein
MRETNLPGRVKRETPLFFNRYFSDLGPLTTNCNVRTEDQQLRAVIDAFPVGKNLLANRCNLGVQHDLLRKRQV